MSRNYRAEYDNYHSSPKQKKNRAARNAARAAMVKAGKVKKEANQKLSFFETIHHFQVVTAVNEQESHFLLSALRFDRVDKEVLPGVKVRPPESKVVFFHFDS